MRPRLARQIIQRWTTPLERMGNIGAFTEAELNRLGLDPEAVMRQVTVANAESGDLLRDSALAFWNNVNQEYERSYPGHNRVTEMLSVRQAEIQARMVDSDPNPDWLGKQRQNLGEYIFQVQQNLRALIPAKEDALRGFISACVNNPNRRHGIARAFLDQTSERFRAFADGLGKQRDAAKESLAPTAGRRDANIGAINKLAGDVMLAMIMNAKKREIDEKKDEYLQAARQWDTTAIDIKAMDAAIDFYSRMANTLERLKGEMDSYIERMRALEAYFRKQEQTAIESPVDVNGIVLFDAGRRVESQEGITTYEDGDIDQRYGVYVGNGGDPGNPTVTTASNDAFGRTRHSGKYLRPARHRSAAYSGSIDRAGAERLRGGWAGVGSGQVLRQIRHRYGQSRRRTAPCLRAVAAFHPPSGKRPQLQAQFEQGTGHCRCDERL